jgi:hypothetical protein
MKDLSGSSIKLASARRQAGRYLVTRAESVTELDDLAEIATFADAVYADRWTGRKITPSA